MPVSSRVKAGPRDYYVLARWLKRENRYECFMLTGKEAKQAVRRGERRQRSRRRAGYRKGLNPSLSVTKDPERANRWRRRWLKWRL